MFSMKKKILAGILIMVFALATVMGVSAAGSSQGNVTVVGPNVGSYIIRSGTAAFTDDNNNNEPIANKGNILAYNAETMTLAQLLGSNSSILAKLKGMKDLTKIFDLYAVNGGAKEPGDDNHRVTLKVPALSNNCTDVKVLHYSVEDGAWEILEESGFDKANKTVTVVTDDLSPIAIFVEVSGGSGSGQSPATGVNSSAWMIWTAAALVVLGSGVVIVRKKRQ